MDNVKRVNNHSAKLLEKVNEFLPKKGQTIWFTSVRPNARGTTVPSIDRIFDPWGGDNGEGDFIDIAYITGRDPGKGTTDLPRDILGRIQFTKSAGGRIGIRGGDRAGEVQFTYLFLTNFLKNNAPTKTDEDGKPWYVPGHPAICVMDEPEKSADQKLEDNRLIRQAGNAIDEMPESVLRDFALGLDMKGVTKHSSANEIRVKLLQMAATTDGAKKVLSLDKDTTLRMKIEIKEAEKFNIIEFDTQLSVWRWVAGGETISVVPPTVRKYDPIISFFLSKGAESYRIMLKLLAEEKSKPEKEVKPKGKVK